MPNVSSPLRVGNAVLIRTVTMIQVGRTEEIGDHEIVLSEAAWVAETTRLKDCLATGECLEVEPAPDGVIAVGRGAIVDIFNWTHALPLAQK